MRVVAGTYKSRPLKAVPGMNTRPTTDKIKEGMFNLLNQHLSDGVCLDFYGGSGALAIEAVSRGMSRAVITEKFPTAIEVIKANITMTKEEAKFTVLLGDNRHAISQLKLREPNLVFDLVLLDPPYKLQRIIEDIEFLQSINVIDGYTTIMCETDDDTALPQAIANNQWVKVKFKEYGMTRIHVYAGKDELA